MSRIVAPSMPRSVNSRIAASRIRARAVRSSAARSPAGLATTPSPAVRVHSLLSLRIADYTHEQLMLANAPAGTVAERRRPRAPERVRVPRPCGWTGLFERLVRHAPRFTPGQQPADDDRDERHADHDDEQVRDRDGRDQGGQATVQRVGAEPARGGD